MKILIVEDNALVREVIADCLSEAGHTVSAAASETEAAQLMDSNTGFELLVTDFDLGGTLNGVDIAAVFRECFPGANVLMISGDPRLAREKIRDSGDFIGVLAKPFRHSELILAIERLTANFARFEFSHSIAA